MYLIISYICVYVCETKDSSNVRYRRKELGISVPVNSAVNLKNYKIKSIFLKKKKKKGKAVSTSVYHSINPGTHFSGKTGTKSSFCAFQRQLNYVSKGKNKKERLKRLNVIPKMQ